MKLIRPLKFVRVIVYSYKVCGKTLQALIMILYWLQQVVTNVTGASKHVGRTASNFADSMQSWMNNWYLIEVRSC